MPDSNMIDPSYSRERGMFETEEDYAERMKQRDKRTLLLESIGTRHPVASRTWILTGPDGRTYKAGTPLDCCAAEQRDRIPADVMVERLFNAAAKETDIDG